MPNHVTNEITASEHVIASLIGPERAVDFNTVIPMPEIMESDGARSDIEDWAKIALGIITIESLQVRHENPAEAFKRGDYGAATKTLKQSNCIRMLTQGPFPKDFDDKDFEQFIRYMRALKQFGHANWYEWSLEHWGTKWNAYDHVVKSPTCVRFDTAWSMPGPVIAALSKKFPTEKIRIRWADEDSGNNAGDATFLNGEVISGDRFKNGSREAYDTYVELCHDGTLPDDMERTEDGGIRYLETSDT